MQMLIWHRYFLCHKVTDAAASELQPAQLQRPRAGVHPTICWEYPKHRKGSGHEPLDKLSITLICCSKSSARLVLSWAPLLAALTSDRRAADAHAFRLG